MSLFYQNFPLSFYITYLIKFKKLLMIAYGKDTLGICMFIVIGYFSYTKFVYKLSILQTLWNIVYRKCNFSIFRGMQNKSN